LSQCPDAVEHGCGRGSLPDYWWHGRYGFSPGSISRPDKSQASASRAFWTACKEQWEQWLATHDPEDAISCKIQKVQALEALGAEVLIISADVANHAQMQAAIAQSLKRFGKIHGVIHAGVAGAGMIQLKTPEIAKSVFAQTYGNVGTE